MLVRARVVSLQQSTLQPEKLQMHSLDWSSL
jgi:hypothetical protein